MLYDALSMGKKTPKIAPSPWDFVTLQEEDRAMVIGNMPKKFVKDRACGSTVILADKQTHTHTQTCSLQYFATAPAGKVPVITKPRHIVTPTTSATFLAEREFSASCYLFTVSSSGLLFSQGAVTNHELWSMNMTFRLDPEWVEKKLNVQVRRHFVFRVIV